MAETLRVSSILDEHIVLNVGGKRYETFKGTLKSIPDTRLAWVAGQAPHETAPEYDSRRKEFFFDRHSAVFEEILNYYRTGKLHCPRNVCSAVIEEEFSFWGIDETQMEACCWPEFNRQRAAIKILKDFNNHENPPDKTDSNTSQENRMKRFPRIRLSKCKDNLRKKKQSFFTRHYQSYREAVWRTLEEPYSSISAKVIAFVSMAFIIMSVVDFSLATIPTIHQGQPFRLIEPICGAWFTLEILLRFAFCPSVKSLLKRPLTWVDIGALLPLYLNLVLNMYKMEFGALVILRLLKVFRLFRYSARLQVMALALKGSLHELCLLFLILVVSVFFFSTLVHYAEYREGSGNKSFQNIPVSFWWTVVTLTTVGYGDVTPETWLGKLLGGVCAIWGVLMIALPVSIVNSNFSLYYSHGQALMRLPRKTTRNPFSPSIRRYLDYYDTISQLSLNCRHKRERGFSNKAKPRPSFTEDALRCNIPKLQNGHAVHEVPTYKFTVTSNAGERTSTSRDSIDTVNIPLMPSDWAINIEESSDNEAEGLVSDNSPKENGILKNRVSVYKVDTHDSCV